MVKMFYNPATARGALRSLKQHVDQQRRPKYPAISAVKRSTIPLPDARKPIPFGSDSFSAEMMQGAAAAESERVLEAMAAVVNKFVEDQAIPVDTVEF